MACARRSARELLDPQNVDVVVAVTTWEKLVSTEASGMAAKIIVLEWPLSPNVEREVWAMLTSRIAGLHDVLIYLDSDNDPGGHRCPECRATRPIVHQCATL